MRTLFRLVYLAALAVIIVSGATEAQAGVSPQVNISVSGYLPAPPGVHVYLEGGRPCYTEGGRRVYLERDKKHRHKHDRGKHKGHDAGHGGDKHHGH